MNSRKENPNWFVDKLTLYQAANSTPEAIKRNFLIRLAEFELIIADLRSKSYRDPVQHELILGRRGSGKSTLLRRIQIEIDEAAELSEQYIAINLAEEQHAIYRLSDLWFEVVQELMIRLEKQEKLRDFDDFEDNQAYTRYLYAEIHGLLQHAGKKVVLLLDNLDRILENFNDDGHLLRETLLNYQDLQLIGASTRMDEHFWRYDQPFYEFFRRHRLEGLDFEDIHRLLNHWSAELNLPELHDYALRHRGRIEAIRILTDGLPRAILIFIQLLLHDSTLYGFDYLRKVMDLATPIYQERLGHLTPPQRKIVQEMAFEWKAAPTKLLVEKCRMESKLIASYLKQLERFGIVETIPTSTKNNLYRLTERFFNMWLIVTQGNPDQKRRARYLTLFLEAWYDGEELKALAVKHLGDLMAKNVTYDKAVVLSKALSQSKFIGVVERDALIESTHQLDARGGGSELPRKFREVAIEANQLVEANNFTEALIKLEEIENEDDGVIFSLKAYCFLELNKPIEAEKLYLEAINKGHISALHGIAILYRKQGKLIEAEHYFLQAIAKGQMKAYNNLAILYEDMVKNDQAEQFYLAAVRTGSIRALYNLAIFYKNQGKEDAAEYYFLQAIEKGDTGAFFNLAVLYMEQGKILEAEKYYIKAIQKEHPGALNNLAVLYQNQNKVAEAEEYYIRAIDKGRIESFISLAGLYYLTNQKGQEALNYGRSYYEVAKNESRLPNLIILEIWNGIFEDLPEKIERVLQNNQDNDLSWFLTNLLYHQQKHLVLSLFESETHGKMLRERYELLYYATLILTQKTEDNLLLKIPPEVMPTLEAILEDVKEKQAFYAQR